MAAELEGGSYWVRVSLCRTAMWVQDLGRVNQSDIPNPISQEEREPFMMECDSPYGKLKHVAPVAKYSDTPSYYEKACRSTRCTQVSMVIY